MKGFCCTKHQTAYVFVPGSPEDADLLPHVMGLKLPRWVISHPFDDRPLGTGTFVLLGPYGDAIDGGVKAVAVGYLWNLW